MSADSLQVFRKTQVNLAQMHIRNEGLKIVCQQQTHHIVILKLRNNDLTNEGLISISKAKWVNLTILYLTQNMIRNKGCKYLSQALLPIIKQIGLGLNQIESVGAFHLSKGIWDTLQEIYLFNNKLKSDSVRHLIRANWPNLKVLSMECSFHTVFQALNLSLYSGVSINQLRISIQGNDVSINICKEVIINVLMSKLRPKYPNIDLSISCQ